MINLRRCTPGGVRRLSAERAWLGDVLADLLDMGIPLVEALSRLQGRSRPMDDALRTMRAIVCRGGRLSYAVEATDCFPPRWGPVLRAAEESAALPDALRSLAALESRESCVPYETLAWGALSLLILGGIMLFLGTFIMPTFVSLHEGLNIDLPWTTRVFCAVARFFRVVPPSWTTSLILLLAILIVQRHKQWVELTIRLLDGLGWREPALRDQALAASVLAAGLRVDMPVPEALHLAATTVMLPRSRRALASIDPSTSLAEGLARNPLFDAELVAVCTIAEDRETLVDGLTLVAGRLLARADSLTARARQLLGMAVALLVGGAVALVAVGVTESMVNLITHCLEALLA